MNKESKYNAPRVGKKRWSTKYKKKINCSNPKGFSQKQYCKRKSRGGAYKSSFEIFISLVKIANHLDSISLTSEADVIDSILFKIAKDQSRVEKESEVIRVYHGTPFLDAASKIKEQGLRSNSKKRVGGDDKGYFKPLGKRNYITKEKWNATRYSFMKPNSYRGHWESFIKEEPFGFVFEFEVSKSDLLPDEDEIGNIVYNFLKNKKHSYIEKYINDINSKLLSEVKKGSFKAYAAVGKIIEPKLSHDDLIKVIDDSSSFSIEKNIKPTRCFKIQKPDNQFFKTPEEYFEYFSDNKANVKLAKESISYRLQKIVNKDQNLRKSWEKLVLENGGWDIPEDKMNDLRIRFAEEHGTNLNSLFGDEEGQEQFLKMLEEGIEYDTLSQQDWKNIFTISQHFDSRRDIQKKMKEVFKKYLGTDSQEYKYISDRISCGESGEQEFGTQYICEID